ncbi:MAG TPA: hypothetical protein VM686_38560 [Polyangiaceae bacterium]|jgi:hypothetical protein|nr:hypothetical protein [Polyangiaceae bacterium]
MRFSEMVLAAFIASPSGGAAEVEQVRPPSSLRPPAAAVTVHVVHRHQQVKSCKDRGERRCVPVMEDASGAATIRLQLVSPPNTVNASSTTTIVDLPDAIGLQEGSAELGSGQWSVAWVGHSVSGRLALTSGSSPLIALETVSGRCSLRNHRCVLDDRARLRSMGVSDQR